MFLDILVNVDARNIAQSAGFYRDLLGFGPFYRFPWTGEPEHVGRFATRTGDRIASVADPDGDGAQLYSRPCSGRPADLVS